MSPRYDAIADCRGAQRDDCCSGTSRGSRCRRSSTSTALKRLGVPAAKLSVTGSIKYDGAAGERDTPQTRALRTALGLEGPTSQPSPKDKDTHIAPLPCRADPPPNPPSPAG